MHERPGSNRLRLAGCWESHRVDARVAGCPTIARRVLRSNCLTIARYSAATSSGLRNTGRERGGIAGRWMKPVAASLCCGVPSKARSLSRSRLGELYPA